MLRAKPSIDELREFASSKNASFKATELYEAIIIGAAGEGRRLFELLTKQNIEVISVFDRSEDIIGNSIGSLTVKPQSEILSIERHIPVIIASHRTLETYKFCKAENFENVVPFMTLQTTRPDEFPPHEFHASLLEDMVANSVEYIKLFEELEDDLSRKTLNAIIGYRLTGNPCIFESVLDNELYNPSQLLKFSDKEVFIDGGAYTGDTILNFMHHVDGEYEKIYAFEPDPETFSDLVRNFSNHPNVIPIDKGLFSERTTLKFSDAGGRASVFSETGEISVPVTSIDEVLNGDRVSFIKMNIEGAEIEALKGARLSIEKWQPKLAISVYHRPSDLWKIPKLIQSIDASYRIHLRQQDGGLIESVCFGLARE